MFVANRTLLVWRNVMSDTNDALQALQASIDDLKKTVDSNTGTRAAETAVLFTVVSLMLAELPPDTRVLIEDSLSVWADGLSDPALAAQAKEIARQRLGMKLVD
ncbi:hypothetical protein BDAG_04948 [Burkholderia dolosa AU0158]|nr:hypothetical protein BDAG_04948 [Burkholderia dolosa AU0158]